MVDMVDILSSPKKLVALLLLSALNAQASSELVLQFDSSLRYESNPLAFSDGADVQGSLGSEIRSDRVLSNEMRFSLTHSLDSSETRLVFDGQLGQREYTRLDFLDHNPYIYRAGLEWRAGHLWRGAVFHSQDQKLFDYQDGSLTERERLYKSTQTIEVALRVTPDVEIPVVLKKQRRTYDLERNSFNESNEHNVDVGVSLNSETTSKLRAGVLSTEVQFTNRTVQQVSDLGDSYRDRELYFDVDWHYSVKTRLGGRLATLQREYGSLPELNFSAPMANFSLDYDYSPMTKIKIEAWRRPLDATKTSVLYSMNYGAQLSLRWQATSKTRLSMQIGKELDRYQTTRSSVNPPNPVFSRIRKGASVNYAVSRDLSLYIDGFTEELTGGDLGSAISQRTLVAGLEYNFENMSGLAKRLGLGAHR
jgi:hypothetical protein